MSGKRFNLADVIRAADARDAALAGENVSDLDTGPQQEQIEYIDIDLLDDDPRNFYRLDGLEELAANIELCGLQQPLRVRPVENGHAVIISGHRRRAAIRKLVDEGREDLREIPCIREYGGGSEALQELRLIYANSDTRQLTAQELSQQAQRVEALLYQLKEEGYEFPGRMRDHVAEACKVSRTKLANLKTIREHLTPEWKGLWEQEKINESLALTIARMPEERQRLCYTSWIIHNKKHMGYYEYTAQTDAKRLDSLDKLHCPKSGGACENAARKWEHLCPLASWTDDSCARICCRDCCNLGRCKYSCAKLTDDAEAAREKRREQKRQEKDDAALRERPEIELNTALWQRFAEARKAAGLSVEQYEHAIACYYCQEDDDKYAALERGEGIEAAGRLPYGYSIRLDDIKKLRRAADALGVSLDRLLCHDTAPHPEGQTASCAGWMPGDITPAEPGEFVVLVDFGSGELRPHFSRWTGAAWEYCGVQPEVVPAWWMRLPPVPTQEGGSGDDPEE